jgi:hypothetical protein
MRNGIPRDDEGFELLIDGVPRTFRDKKGNAYSAARVLKQSNRGSIVEIRERATGRWQIMLEDGLRASQSARQQSFCASRACQRLRTSHCCDRKILTSMFNSKHLIHSK